MSQENAFCKPTFKGIENFLRRIAFNLGNSPSQTEVKIISCIPIDVTDLQQKILLLEKELSDAKKQKSASKHKNNIDCNRFCCKRKGFYNPMSTSTMTRPIAVSECNKNSSLDLDHTLDRNLSNMPLKFSSDSKHIFEALYDRTVSEQSIKSKWNKRKFIANRCVRNIFRKGKKQTPNRGQAQFVYYAHTEYDPNLRKNLSYTYLTDVFRKHYDPELALHEYPDTSHFSVPFCRDLTRNGKKLSPPDSEVCSCCHGRFQNVDIHMKDVSSNDAAVKAKARKMKRVKNNQCLVNSSPVRKKSFNNTKLRNEKFEKYYKNKDNCCLAQEQRKHRYCYNYPTDTYKEFRPPNPKCRHSCKKHSTRIKARSHETFITNKDTLKRHHKYKDPKSLQENISSSEIRSAIYDCTKTEVIINEIKKMLRSVLTEIKPKTEMHAMHIKEETTKRDAVIQNNQSRDMQRSTFLNSFMYNSPNYCTNPYPMSYAGQIPLTQYCFSNIPFQPVNYHTKPPTQMLCSKMTSTRSTNTDIEDNITDKETGKLIKEIYKSLNANADPSNDESYISEHRTATVNLEGDTKRDAEVEALLSSQISYMASNNIVNTITYKPDYKINDNVVHRLTDTDDISEEDEDDEYTETISTSDVTTLKVAKKSGVLTKILSVFKKKKRNNDEETEISDTSNYETVFTAYTDKANNTPQAKRPATGINIRVPASRPKNKQSPQDECRKQWIEDLLNDESRYYAPKNKTQLLKSYPKPAYRQEYETRPVFVLPKSNYYATIKPKYGNANKMCKLPTGRLKKAYLRNPKLMRCGRNWKKIILES